MGHAVLKPAILLYAAMQPLQPTIQQALEPQGADKQDPQLTVDGR